MSKYEHYRSILAVFAGTLSDEQKSILIDEMKRELSIADMESLLYSIEGSNMYYELSQYDAEMGGLQRY